MKASPVLDRWYVRLIAGYYMVVCSLWWVGYGLKQDLSRTGASISWPTQVLCLLGALSGLMYFVKLKWGYLGLLCVTVSVLLLHCGENNPEALSFHTVVLILLLLPLRTRILHRLYQAAPSIVG